MDKTEKREKFLRRIAYEKNLDELDKAAIREGLLLQSLKAHQRGAAKLISVIFKSGPE